MCSIRLRFGLRRGPREQMRMAGQDDHLSPFAEIALGKVIVANGCLERLVPTHRFELWTY